MMVIVYNPNIRKKLAWLCRTIEVSSRLRENGVVRNQCLYSLRNMRLRVEARGMPLDIAFKRITILVKLPPPPWSSARSIYACHKYNNVHSTECEKVRTFCSKWLCDHDSRCSGVVFCLGGVSCVEIRGPPCDGLC